MVPRQVDGSHSLSSQMRRGGGEAGRSACDEIGGRACVCTDSSVLPPRCELKGVGAQTCHVVLLTLCSHSGFFIYSPLILSLLLPFLFVS